MKSIEKNNIEKLSLECNINVDLFHDRIDYTISAGHY